MKHDLLSMTTVDGSDASKQKLFGSLHIAFRLRRYMLPQPLTLTHLFAAAR